MRTLKLLSLFMAAGLAVVPGCAVPTDDSPPAGFVKLFNGQDLTGWKDDGSGHWRAENGMIVYDGGVSPVGEGGSYLLAGWLLKMGVSR